MADVNDQSVAGNNEPCDRVSAGAAAGAGTTAGAGTVAGAVANVDVAEAKPERLVSLDAYRGFIMVLLAGSGFGIAKTAANFPDSEIWQTLGFHFTHSEWIAYYGLIGCPFWDLIMPAFLFMAGVAMPYSYAKRKSRGNSPASIHIHIWIRALVLILLGLFLSSQRSTQTNFRFAHVLCQLGLAYPFAFMLMGRKLPVRLLAIVGILVGYWLLFVAYPAAGPDFDFAAVNTDESIVMTGLFAHWNKNANIGSAFDVFFLNLFPRPKPFVYDDGGYPTLNFIPSIVTVLFGVLCGQLLRCSKNGWVKLLLLILAGGVCMILGVLAGRTICPIGKRLWTPSWVLLSGAWVIWMLAAFYLVIDLVKLKRWTFPFVVVGMNSIAIYMMGQTMAPWMVKMMQIHFGQEIFDGRYGLMIQSVSVLLVFWLICWWMYRQKVFIRI